MLSHSPAGGGAKWLLIALWLSLTLAPAALAQDPATPAAPPDPLTLTLDTPAYSLRPSGDGLTVVDIEGYGPQGQPGDPLLPARAIDVALPPDADPATLTLAITAATVVDVPGAYQIAPAPPPVTSPEGQPYVEWGPNAAQIVDGRNTAVYGHDAFYPAAVVSLESTGALRQWQAARLLYAPVQYNPVTGQLRVTTAVSLTLSYGRLSAGQLAQAAPAGDTLLDDVAAQQFVNYDQAQPWYGGAAAPAALPGYVVITTNQIYLASTKMDAFLDHKSAQGYQTWLVTEDNYGSLSGQAPNGRAEKIRQWLKTNYASKNILYVLLIGSPDPDEPGVADSVGDLPMKMLYPRYEQTDYRESPSDYFYADLTGNWDLDGDTYYGEFVGDRGANGMDYLADVYVGRIPVYTARSGWAATLDSILQKTMDYELASNVGWRRKALLPMPFSDASTDAAYLAEQMKSDYLNGRGFTSYTLYQQGTEEPAFNSIFASNQELIWPAVRNHWQSNAYGLVVWWTHGWWGGASLVLNYDETPYLNNARPALTYQASCNNGEPEQVDNLGYALLRQGAIGTVSASRVSWYYPGIFGPGSCPDNGTLAYSYGNRISANVPAGRALYQMKGDYASCVDGTLWMNLDDFNLYGDPSISLASSARPDLVPYTPDANDYPVTPASVKSTDHTAILYSGHPTYFDWFAKNAGSAAASGNFQVEVWVDGYLMVDYPFANWGAGSWGGSLDWGYTVPAPGWHTVKMIVDPDNTIAESNEDNNVWQQDFYWEPADGCWAEYFNNETLSGDPVLVADEAGIDHEWGYDGPAGQGDHFSARWTCNVPFDGGAYRFTWGRDDGLRIFLDDVNIFNAWNQGHEDGSFDRTVSAGTHVLRVESNEIDGYAKTHLRWESLNGWTATNIGALVSGSTYISGNTVTLGATGGDIWSTADGLRYVYKSGSGNQTFIAKLTAWNPNGVTSAKTGLTLRASNDPASPQYTIHVNGTARAIKVKYRTSSGWSTANINGATSSNLPLWLKLVKNGNTVAGYTSTNGTSWTAVGAPQTIAGIAAGFLYGLSVASTANTSEAVATYQIPSADGPTITGFSPSSGGPGTLVTINGTNLGGATVVRFAGTSASFNVVSATQLQASVPAGAVSGPITVVTPNGTASSATDFIIGGDTLSEVYVGASAAGTVGGVAFTAADILHYTRDSNTWHMLFDASDVGLSGNVSAFTFLPDGTILLVLGAKATLPGVGLVTPMDVIQFVPTQLGEATSGAFRWYFDGSDVGLAASGEKIDALSYFVNADGSQRLRLSTTGVAKVTHEAGGTLTAQDEDLIVFVIGTTGATTSGRWLATLHLDGSAIPGLAAKDVNGYAHDGLTFSKYILITGSFTIGGVSGNGKSVLKLTPDGAAVGGHRVSLVTWLAPGATFPTNVDSLEIIR